MAHPIEMNAQLAVSLALGGRLLLKAQILQRAGCESGGATRRELRQLRSLAMIELALAWRRPAWPIPLQPVGE